MTPAGRAEAGSAKAESATAASATAARANGARVKGARVKGAKAVRPVKVTRRTVPSLRVERVLWDAGAEVVVGVDEVGRGAWAGPISVGAAVLPPDRRVYKVRDSKMLTEAEREHLFDRVAGWCRAWAVGHASQVECDTLGMSAAQKLAAQRAIAGLGVEPDHVLVDGSWDFVAGGGARRIVKGDATCLSIAAASILAKVTRDRMMRQEARHYPLYDFEYNKGYPCPRHKAALKAWGPSAIHRRTWVFMEHLPWWRVSTGPPDGDQQLAFDLA